VGVDGQSGTAAIASSHLEGQWLLNDGIGDNSGHAFSLMDNGVDLFDDGADLLGDSSVGLDHFAHLLDDRFVHFVDESVGLVLEGGVLDGADEGRCVRLLHLDSAGRRAEVDLDGQVVGVHLNDLGLRHSVLNGHCSQLDGAPGVDGSLDRSAVCLLGSGV